MSGAKQRIKLSSEEIAKANGQLRRSVMLGDYVVAEKLLSEGIVNIEDSPCDLLYTAVANRDAQMVKLLLAHGAKLNLQETVVSGEKRHSYFWSALLWMNYEICKLLINADVNAAVQKGTGTYSNVYSLDSRPRIMYPLQYAISRAHDEMIDLLLKHTDINVCDNQGDSILSYAVTYKLRDLVLDLIKKGANVNARNNAGYTIIHIAALTGSIELVKLLLEMNADYTHPENISLLHCAARSVSADSVELLEMLLQRGFPTNVPDSSGDTPLHTIVKPNQATVLIAKAIKRKVELLLHYEADLFKKNTVNGESPIAMLARRRVDYPTHTGRWELIPAHKKPTVRLRYLKDAYAYFIPIVMLILKLQFRNEPINEDDIEIILQHPCLSTLYEEFKRQFTELEQLIVNDHHSIANIFSMSNISLAILTFNEKFVENFRKVDLLDYPSFADEVTTKFESALEIKKRLVTIESELNSIFNLYLPKLAIQRIAMHLLKEEIKWCF